MTLPESLASVRDRINRALLRSGRGDATVEIVAVTKSFPASTILAAYNVGIHSIGENRVQEARDKFLTLPPLRGLTKRMVGHLQTNKARLAATLFDSIDSVDSVVLTKRLAAIAQERGQQMRSLLEVNTSGEPSKNGFVPGDEEEMLAACCEPWVCVEGLMTVGPLTENAERIRASFRSLAQLQERLNNCLPAERRLGELSMGMSGDFELAVEEGATMVRLGTVLFGERGRQ